jgi:hypothetical protein
VIARLIASPAAERQKIVVYTEWLAPNGSALPEGLAAVGGAQYGLT